MLDLSAFSQIRPPTPPPNPLDQYGKVLSLADTASQIQQRQAQAQKNLEGQQKLANIQKILSDPASHDPTTGQVTQDAQSKIMGVDSEFGLSLQKSYADQKEKVAANAVAKQNADTAAENATTEAAKATETVRHNKAQEAEPTTAEKDYKSWLKSENLPDNATSRVTFKMQGTKVSPGETVIGGGGIPNFSVPRVPVPGVDIPYTPEVQQQKINIAKSEKVDPEQVVQGQDKDGSPAFYVVDKNAGTSKLVAGVAPKVGPTDAPAQLKQQIPAALTTLASVDQVRKLAAAKPQLIGPVAGRVNELGQMAGGNPFQGSADEQDAALMANKLGYLFANEVRSAMPGRPQAEITARLAQVSGQMKDNPNMLEGFLKGAEQNANNAIDIGAKYGIKEALQSQQQRGQSTSGAPIVQKSPSTGAFRYSTDGGKTWNPGQPPNK